MSALLPFAGAEPRNWAQYRAAIARVRRAADLLQRAIDDVPMSGSMPDFGAVKKALVQMETSVSGMAVPKADDLVECILDACAEYYDVNVLDILDHCRRPKTVNHARHMGMFLARNITGMSFPSIGRIMDGRDSTTVQYGVNRMAQLVRTSSRVRAEAEALSRKLMGQTS